MSMPADSLPRTLTDQAYLRLRSDVISGAQAPGSKLRIERLREQYGMGATPIREALSRLSADGFVTAEGQRGFRVAPVSVQDLNDVTEMRVLLETRAVLDSVTHGDDAWEARVVAAYHRLNKAEAPNQSDFDVWEPLNREFHAALMAACTSAWLHRFHAILYDQHRRYRNISLQARSIPRDIHAEHKQLHDAALARDAARCCELTEAHIRRTAEIALKVLSEASGA